MNISRKWLKEFVDITATDKEYDEIMTIAGQKVETTTRMDEDIKMSSSARFCRWPNTKTPTTCGSAW